MENFVYIRITSAERQKRASYLVRFYEQTHS